MQADSGINIDDPLYFEVVSTFLNSTSTHDIDPAAVKSCQHLLISVPEESEHVRSQEKYDKCVLDWRVQHGSWAGEQTDELYEIDPTEITIVRCL